MTTLTGNITDVTGRAPDSISSITVKAPSARIGGGSDIIVTSPAKVTLNKTTGDITLTGLHVGLSWLYIEGDGWSDSIPLAVAEGFQLILEAVANASGIPGIADYVLMIRNSGEHAILLAQAALDGEFGAIVRAAQTAATTAAQSATSAENTVDSYTPRVDALEAMAGLSPESPVDGQTANLVSQTDTLTRAAVDSVLGDTLSVVTHGEDTYYPRPVTSRRVLWLGAVVPLNRRAGDLVPEVVPVPAPWSPEMLDLVAWYDPADGYEPGTVAQITDRGPRNLHMAIGGTGGISIDTSTLALPAFANGGTAFATSPLLPAGAWEHPVTVYMVASLSALSLSAVSAFFDNGPGSSSNRVAMWAARDGRLSLNQGISVSSERDTFLDNTPFLLAATFSGGADTYAEVNGSGVIGPADAGSNKLGSIRLFANGAGGNISDAAIGDVIIAKNVTSEQHADVTEWLRTKWGLA